MVHTAHRFMKTSLGLLVVLALMLGFVQPVFAEGEVPEDVPPAATSPLAGSSPATTAAAGWRCLINKPTRPVPSLYWGRWGRLYSRVTSWRVCSYIPMAVLP